MSTINVLVLSKENVVNGCYVIDVNKLSKFEHVCRDSFLDWHIFFMLYRRTPRYNFVFEKLEYVCFFHDFLTRYYGRCDLLPVERLLVTTRRLYDESGAITLGGDESWQ